MIKRSSTLFSDEERGYVVECIEAGDSIAQIAEDLLTTPEEIEKLLNLDKQAKTADKSEYKEIFSRDYGMKDEDVKCILNAFDSGASFATLASMFHISREKIKKMILDSGRVIQPFADISKPYSDKIIEEYLAGVSAAKIASDRGRDKQYVVSLLKKAGVFVSNRGKKSSDKASAVSSSSKKEDKAVRIDTKPKTSKSRKKEEPEEEHIPTREEKIAYCNAKYGKGRWEFLTKEQALPLLMEYQAMLQEFKNM